MPADNNSQAWNLTYANMMTLLMVGFIVIVSLGARGTESAKATAGKRDARRPGLEKDGIVIRTAGRIGDPASDGLPSPDVHSDVSLEDGKSIRTLLDNQNLGQLADSYEVVFPLGLMFESPGQMSRTGQGQVQRLAQVARQMPYDLLIQVADPEQLPYALTVYRALFRGNHIHPARIAVGVRPATREGGKLWLVMRRVL